MGRIWDFLSNVDMLGPAFSLNLNGYEKLKTPFGSLLTLICIYLIIQNGYVIVLSYFQRTGPIVGLVTETVEKAPRINFGYSNMLPIILMTDISARPSLLVESAQIETHIGLQLSVSKVVDLANGSRGYQTTLYNGTRCSSLSSDSKKFNYMGRATNYPQLKNYIDTHAYCLDVPDPSLIFIEGSESDKNPTLMKISILHCLPSSGVSCAPQSEIGKYSFEIVFPTIVPNLNSYSIPTEMNILLGSSIKILDFDLLRTQVIIPVKNIVSDTGQILSTLTQRDEFIELEFLPMQYSIRNASSSSVCTDPYDLTCEPLFSVNFLNAFKIQKYTRQYKTVTQALSEIGGISIIFLNLFSYINAVYLYFARDKIITSRLFPSLVETSSGAKGGMKNFALETKTVKELEAKRKKQWKQMKKDAIHMIDSSLDLGILFRELCNIRVLSRVFLDDHQEDLVTLSSLQLYNKDKETEKKNAERLKKKNSNLSNKIIELRKNHFDHLQYIRRRINKRKIEERTSVENRIDIQLRDSVINLDLEFLDPSYIDRMITEYNRNNSINDKSPKGGEVGDNGNGNGAGALGGEEIQMGVWNSGGGAGDVNDEMKEKGWELNQREILVSFGQNEDHSAVNEKTVDPRRPLE